MLQQHQVEHQGFTHKFKTQSAKYEVQLCDLENLDSRSSPSWIRRNLECYTSLTQVKRIDLPNAIYNLEFINICGRYESYLRIFTDGSKNDMTLQQHLESFRKSLESKNDFPKKIAFTQQN